MESLKIERDKKLSDILRLANTISGVAKDTLDTRVTSVQGRNEITRYAKEIIKIAKEL